MRQCEVLIVGLGPSGMLLANELQKHDIDYLIVDKRAAISNVTRAVNVTPASLAILRYSSDLTIKNQGFKTNKIVAYWHKKLISRISYKYQKFPYKDFFYLPQPELESLLYEKIHDKENRVKENTEVVSIENISDGHLVNLLDEHANPSTIKCQYLIGCDGNSSFVRNWANISSDEENYFSSFLLYDVETDETITTDSSYYLFDDGYIIIVPINRNNYRIIYSIKKSISLDLRDKNSIDFVVSVLKKHCNISARINRIIWSTQSGFKHRIARKCRKANIFLVGDAFHVFSPVGGLNLSTGLQDALNLGWKLSFVIKGVANKQLLDTYAEERSVSVKKAKDKTKHLTKVMTSATSYSRALFYITNLANRRFIKTGLPMMLSGYESYGKIQFHFSELVSHEENYHSICELLDNKKFNLIMSHHVDFDWAKNTYIKKITVPEIPLWNKYLLLRPDGYILKIGKIENLSRLPAYIENYLRG
jgi:2-polyprenyl-6-methoxyphenol hydroxylase-like FAD-dependent oxidoreductase